MLGHMESGLDVRSRLLVRGTRHEPRGAIRQRLPANLDEAGKPARATDLSICSLRSPRAGGWSYLPEQQRLALGHTPAALGCLAVHRQHCPQDVRIGPSGWHLLAP